MENVKTDLYCYIELSITEDVCIHNGTVGSGNMDEATAQVYELITQNADVIKGIFCGHMHSMFYNEVKATYSDESGMHESVIPQLIAPGNAYLDHAGRVVRIMVK